MNLLNKFPSFKQVQADAVGALGRFPLALLSALVGVVIAIILADNADQSIEPLLTRLLMAASLGLPLFIALTLLADKRKLKLSTVAVIQGAGLLLLIVYFFTLPETVTRIESYGLRHALLLIGLHFVIACLPYIGGNQTHGFWQYNMALLRRVLLATLYAGVLFLGLTIALAAADNLFGIDVKEIRYLQLWIIMAGLFHPWLFLSGVPKDLEAFDEATDYPKGLAVFAQYILLPLVALYFVILIAYEIKIIVDWNWPKGWVSELVLWFSVVGLLSLLMLYPLRKETARRWVQTYVNWLFRALIPLIVLLILAIFRRISEYGVTEFRYLVVAMAIGLALVTLYFLFSKKRDIRIIPIVLGAAALLSAFGPWGASSVSLSSQMNRLKGLLVTNEMLEGDTLIHSEITPSFEDRKEMSDIVRYIVSWHGESQFAELLGEDALDSADSDDRYAVLNDVTLAFGFEFVGRFATIGNEAAFSVSGHATYTPINSFAVTGFDYLVDFALRGDFENTYSLDTISCYVSFDTLEIVLEVDLERGEKDPARAIRFELSDPLEQLVAHYDGIGAPVEDRTFSGEAKDYGVTMVIDLISGEHTDDGLRVRGFEGHLLIRMK